MTLPRCQASGKGDYLSPAHVQLEPIYPHQDIGSLHCRIPAVMTSGHHVVLLTKARSTVSCSLKATPSSTDSPTAQHSSALPQVCLYWNQRARRSHCCTLALEKKSPA